MYPWTAFCLAAAAWVATIWTYHARIAATSWHLLLECLPRLAALGCDAYFYGSVLAYLMQWDPVVKLRQQYDDLGTKHRLPAWARKGYAERTADEVLILRVFIN